MGMESIKEKKKVDRMQGSRNLAVNLHRLIAAKFLDSYNYFILYFFNLVYP